jgi:GNAT superfamily N-acetyltransferase
MTVREARPDDFPAILEMGRRFHEFSPWRDRPFSNDATLEMLQRITDSEDAVLFTNGSGILGGVVAPIYFGGGTVAQELFWFADKGGRALLDAFEAWAKERGADGILMISLALDERTDQRMSKIYERRGYRLRERNFYKEVG